MCTTIVKKEFMLYFIFIAWGDAAKAIVAMGPANAESY